MKNISFDKNILYIGDKNIVFEDEIFQVKIEDDKIYVLLDIKPKEKLTYDDCNNVFCYSGKGTKNMADRSETERKSNRIYNDKF